MITEIPLATLLSIIWAVVFVMAACALSYWAAHRPNVQSQVLNALMRPKDDATRGDPRNSEIGRSDEPPWR